MPNSLNNALTLTIVIPVYNEENYLKMCLDAIASQTVAPLEVIVVDNNSTDKSIQIAKTYDFVKIMTEKRQGQVYAQSVGFNAAKGDILGRIDADTILPDNWIEKVIELFNNDAGVVAITGDANPYDAPLKKIAGGVFRFYHSFISRLVSGHVMLWGANSAFRTSSWKQIRDEMSYRTDVWEDYEMAFLFNKLGRIVHYRGLSVGCSFRASRRPLFPQLAYQYRAVKTFSLHTNIFKTVIFFILWYTMILLFVPMAVNRFIWKLGSRN